MISPSVCKESSILSIRFGKQRESSTRKYHRSLFLLLLRLAIGKKNEEETLSTSRSLILSAPFCTKLVLLLPRRSRQSPSNALRCAQLNKADGEERTRRDGRHIFGQRFNIHQGLKLLLLAIIHHIQYER